MDNKFMFLIGLLGAVLLIVYNNFILDLIAGTRVDFLTILFRIISSTIFIILLFIFYSYLLREDKKNILLFWIVIVITFLVIELLKNLFKVPRPIGVISESGYSFPSRHAALLFASFVIMKIRYMKYKWVFLSAAILITFSRLYLGVHYLGDLLVGGFLGYYIAVFIDKKWK